MGVRVICDDKGVGAIPGVLGGSGGVCRFCMIELDWHKNSDLGSAVGTVTGLNSTTHCLIECVVLLIKQIGIVTPLVLSSVVFMAPRLILYTIEVVRLYRTWSKLSDCIVHGRSRQIILYMGFNERKKGVGKRQSHVSAKYVKSNWNITLMWGGFEWCWFLVLCSCHLQCYVLDCTRLPYSRRYIGLPCFSFFLLPSIEAAYFSWYRSHCMIQSWWRPMYDTCMIQSCRTFLVWYQSQSHYYDLSQY